MKYLLPTFLKSRCSMWNFWKECCNSTIHTCYFKKVKHNFKNTDIIHKLNILIILLCLNSNNTKCITKSYVTVKKVWSIIKYDKIKMFLCPCLPLSSTNSRSRVGNGWIFMKNRKYMTIYLSKCLVRIGKYEQMANLELAKVDNILAL